MPSKRLEEDFDRLPLDEKIEQVQRLWDRIAEEVAREAPTDAQREELVRRLDAIEARDDQSDSWEQVRDRIRAQR